MLYKWDAVTVVKGCKPFQKNSQTNLPKDGFIGFWTDD